MAGNNHRFEFRATLSDLEGGLDTLHGSIDDLRRALGRGADDQPLMYFETALVEIANNALIHGYTSGEHPVQVVVRSDVHTVVGLIVDSGPSVGNEWVRNMPPAMSESGRGLALARSMVDRLEYERKGSFNTWRLEKRL